MTNGPAEFFAEHTDQILAQARLSMARAHLRHYEQGGEEVAAERLRTLQALVVRCARERHLAPILDHAARIAEERRAAGFDLGEVQIAINVLEEAIWHEVLAELPADEQGETLAVAATILGAAKDRLACVYLSLAAGKPVQSLDIAGLFRGPIEGEPALA